MPKQLKRPVFNANKYTHTPIYIILFICNKDFKAFDLFFSILNNIKEKFRQKLPRVDSFIISLEFKTFQHLILESFTVLAKSFQEKDLKLYGILHAFVGFSR